ncbi:hypothetical protein PISMIDRAFT_673162 [Pisolithus microcarpus 441]|uniref:UBX domain-containing protein n=1 Tax=Pisolithus microcarpus 441 TaxID=765257 RepID=A0A0C9ZI39_9AGAM|nr:hypothetical protein BKA83DRAFT_673162 [Pisolithus microcarpus]KIK28901.1 hypothetical protein PISMIDRAFT_673162 [Pisolithus microcarpus 441]
MSHSSSPPVPGAVSSPPETSTSQCKVFKPPTSAVSPRLGELPDSFFTPTAEDLKAAQATLSARTQALVHAPLQLRATREATEKAKRDRWPNTTIRVRFSDRTQLEKTFPSTEKIKSVYTFVHSSLRDDVKPVGFILYQSPPKREFRVSDPKIRAMSLAELQLAPSSVLLARFEDDSLNRSNVPAPLLPGLMARAIELPAPPAFEESARTPGSTTPSNSKAISDKKVPKWMKLGRGK